MTSAGDDDFDFVKTPSLNDATTYGSMTAPSYDPDYRIGNSLYTEDPTEKERQIEKWKEELEATENDIQSLSTTLHTKIDRVNELKQKLGIAPHSPLRDLQLSLQSGIKSIRDSRTYQKTSAAAKTVQEKTTSALSTIGSSMSKKIGDIRNSQTFKSLEEKVETTYTNVKAKVRGSKSDNNLATPAEEGETEARSATNQNTEDGQIAL